MPNEVIIMIIIIIVSTTISGIYSFVISRKKFSDAKVNLSTDEMQQLENVLENFYEQKHVTIRTLEGVLKALNATVEYVDHLDKPDILAEACLNSDKSTYTIRSTAKQGSIDDQFNIAHECAHIIKGDKDDVARTKGKKAKKEQLADYLAGAILLPQRYIELRMKETGFQRATTSQRWNLILEIAKTKNVDRMIVVKRIHEVTELNKKT